MRILQLECICSTDQTTYLHKYLFHLCKTVVNKKLIIFSLSSFLILCRKEKNSKILK